MTDPTAPASEIEALARKIARDICVEYRLSPERYEASGGEHPIIDVIVRHVQPALSALQRRVEEAERERLPHMCRDEHPEIRHVVSDDDERCPVCRERDRADYAESRLAARDEELRLAREALTKIRTGTSGRSLNYVIRNAWETAHQALTRLQAPAETTAASRIEALSRAMEALEDVADPLAALRRRAEAEGARLSSMAYSIAHDPHHIKGIARKALDEIDALARLSSSEPKGGGDAG